MSIWDRNLFIRRLELLWPPDADRSQYPFNLKALHQWNELQFHPSVTYIVGENGVGKSTLIIMKQFLNNKDKMLRELFEDPQ